MTGKDRADTPEKRVIAVHDGPIGWLRIDNAARLNAMSYAMWQHLQAGVETFDCDDAIRVIIVTGHDGQAFCSGGDISEFGNLRPGGDDRSPYDTIGKAALTALRHASKPTIALIEGYCLGGGLALALQCDLRFAADTAQLGLPAAKRGIAYDFDGVQQLVSFVGPSAAKDILYTARRIDGHTACAMGLVNQCFTADAIADAVKAIAMTIAGNAPLSIAAAKVMVDTACTDPALRDLERCANAEAACIASADYAEATRAFMEKRPARFIGR